MAITINYDGDTWEIIGEGTTIDGKTLCHMKSTTRFVKQKNGLRPIQRADWIENELILSAAMQNEEQQRQQHITERDMNASATQEFAATIEECRKLVNQISQCVDDHLDAHPDRIDWGNVGDAKRLMADLLNITAYLNP